jgi:ATP phosphoribosyltransferase regulatory subunit
VATAARWLLPENISDVLPEEARTVERLRRALLDLYAGYGYELVIPPLLEHLDSLLTGSGSDLGLSTIKLDDQMSGRTLGLRADTTPQVARIDSHILNRPGVARLCYAGSTVHARPMHPLASREPFQVGAEIYGDADFAADREILELAVLSARRIGCARVQVDLGHTGVVRALLGSSPGPAAAVEEVLSALNTKDGAALHGATQAWDGPMRSALLALPTLAGGAEVIARARQILPAVAGLGSALDDLDRLAANSPADEISVDLSDMHGFSYHTGATFAIYVGGLTGPLLRGGRYDDIGQAFGRARPATGFSLLDLREAARLVRTPGTRAIRAPQDGDADLEALVAALRAQGEVVVRAPEGAEVGVALLVDRAIVRERGAWRVTDLTSGGKTSNGATRKVGT